MLKEVLKWGLIAIAVLYALRYISGLISGLGNGSSAPAGPVANPSNYPNYYVPGVYGPIQIPWVNPYYSSPLGGGVNRWPRRGW